MYKNLNVYSAGDAVVPVEKRKRLATPTQYGSISKFNFF